MRITQPHHQLAKLLVFMAAALMPWDFSFAFGCGCSDESPGGHSTKSCCGTTSCTCRHAAAPAKRSCCAGRHAALTQSPRGDNGGSVRCTCHSKDRPQPQSPSNGQQNQKEQLASGPAHVALLSAILATEETILAAAHSPCYPASALERCGALCRFLI
jgi:hypothetical protein